MANPNCSYHCINRTLALWLFWGVDATLRYVAEKVPTKEKPVAAVKPNPAAPATNSTEVFATETEAELLSKRMAMLGQIGDLFGGINALFGAFSVRRRILGWLFAKAGSYRGSSGISKRA